MKQMNEKTKMNTFVEEKKTVEKPPFFSVIIATFNRKSTIIRALHSLLAQTETDWEAIVVDDGSTDDTYSEIRSLLEQHKKINYLKQKNKGAAECKNRGIQHARGLYFTFLPDRFNPSQQIHLDNCEIGGTFFIEKELLYSLKGFQNILLGEDADLFERVAKTNAIMLKTDLPTYIYHRETEGSVTNLFVTMG
jgi:predicted glycosyltransferase involved in capsule biosynthesis